MNVGREQSRLGIYTPLIKILSHVERMFCLNEESEPCMNVCAQQGAVISVLDQLRPKLDQYYVTTWELYAKPSSSTCDKKISRKDQSYLSFSLSDCYNFVAMANRKLTVAVWCVNFSSPFDYANNFNSVVVDLQGSPQLLLYLVCLLRRRIYILISMNLLRISLK